MTYATYKAVFDIHVEFTYLFPMSLSEPISNLSVNETILLVIENLGLKPRPEAEAEDGFTKSSKLQSIRLSGELIQSC